MTTTGKGQGAWRCTELRCPEPVEGSKGDALSCVALSLSKGRSEQSQSQSQSQNPERVDALSVALSAKLSKGA